MAQRLDSDLKHDIRPLVVADDSEILTQIERALEQSPGVVCDHARHIRDVSEREIDAYDVMVVWHEALRGTEPIDLLPLTRRVALVLVLRKEDLLKVTEVAGVADAWLFIDHQIELAADIARLSLLGYCLIPRFLAPRFAIDQLRLEALRTLSNREHRVLSELGHGHSNRAIAHNLNMSETAIKSMVRGLLIKLRLRNRTEAGVFAARYDDILKRHEASLGYRPQH